LPYKFIHEQLVTRGLKNRTDLPTFTTCKFGDVGKKPRKTWRLGSQTWRFPKYVLNENKNGRFLVSRYSLPSVHLLYSFPSKIRCDKFGHFQHGFFNIESYYLNCLAISRFSDSPCDLEAKS